MATLASESPPPTPPFSRRSKSWARRFERACCTTLSYFPLTFVYGLTTWAVWVEVTAALLDAPGVLAYIEVVLGAALYALANTSYTTAVFTSPGSPLDQRKDTSKGRVGHGEEPSYEGIPTYDYDTEDDPSAAPRPMTTVTAKSTGQPRYCKKCRCIKPDRTHHCSTCKRCVLKMDHHCPWLATCVGLRNYKPFMLFLIYVSLFCGLCFAVSGSWVWRAVVAESHMEESLRVVNCVMLAVLSGVIGLVLSGFTVWHLYLATTGSTTIESLEKTRYLTPLRKRLQPQTHSQRNYLVDEEAQIDQEQGLLEHLKETHANALPGILREEEGEFEMSRSQGTTSNPAAFERPATRPIQSEPSAAQNSLQHNFARMEEQRERERYAAYLDEQDSEKLPNAFDMGWRRNLMHIFGDRPLLWLLPICNTSGDGWMWEVSPKWTEARSQLTREREASEREEAIWRRERQTWETRSSQPPPRDLRWTPGQGFVRQGTYNHRANGAMPMQPLDRRKGGPMLNDGSVRSNGHPNSAIRQEEDGVEVYDTSSEDDERTRQNHGNFVQSGRGAAANWNDVPEEFLSSGGNGVPRNHSENRRKGD